MHAGECATVVSVVFPAIAAVSVAARLYARCIILRNPGWDDGVILVSLMFSIACSVFIIIQVKYGLGMHFVTLDPEQFMLVLKYLWASIPCYYLSAALTKISLVLQYQRIFVKKKMRIALWTTFSFICCYGIWALFSSIFNCVPIASFWDQSSHDFCFERKSIWFFNASLNLFADIVLVALPMPSLGSLQLARKQKIVLMCIFGLGGFVCIVSILRFYALYKISTSGDPTYDNVAAAIWSVIEINVGILCGSLATLRPLVSRLVPRMLSTSIHRPSHATRPDADTTTTTDAVWKSDSRALSLSSERSPPGHFRVDDIPPSPAAVIQKTVLRRSEIVSLTQSDIDQGRDLGQLMQETWVTTSAKWDVEMAKTGHLDTD